MHLNKQISSSLRYFFENELLLSNRCFRQGKLLESWGHLERAHILAQPYAYEHSFTHWKMLEFGIRSKNIREILGQLPRLIFGGVKSFVGRVPIGNTGGADVPPLRSMEIPLDLQLIIKEHS